MTIGRADDSQSPITNHTSPMSETLLSLVTILALLVALVAWRQARSTAKRLEQLTQMYWELKYQHGELRVRLEGRRDSASPSDEVPAQAAPGGGAFIPLTALKR
jgi:hypothetical protein